MIVKSSSPDVTVPDVSISEFVLRHAERLGEKPALIDGPSGRTLTYRQLADSVKKTAAALARLGGINTTANPLYTADELAKQLADSRARFLVTVAPFLDKAKEAASKS